MKHAAFALLGPLVPVVAIAQTISTTPLPTNTAGTPTAVTTTPGSSETIDRIRSSYHVHAGPLYINPGLLLKELGVDTNVFNQAGDQQSDFTFTVTPKLDLALPLARRGLLRTSAALDAVYYQKFESERSLDPQVTVRAEAYAHRLTFFGQGAYLNTRQRPNYEIDLRARHQENDLIGGVSTRLTSRFSLEIAGHRDRTRFDGDEFFLGSSLRETLDRDVTGYSVTARERLTSLTTVAVRYENDQDRFVYSPLRDNDSYRIMPGVEFKPRALISGSAYAGYRKLTPKIAVLPEYSGLVAQLGLAYTLLGATTFGVTYDRDVTYSYEAISPYYVDNSIGAFMRHAVGGHFDVIVNAARHRYDYRDLNVATLAPVASRVDITDTYGANLGYRLKRSTRVGFGASYYTRKSTRDLIRAYDGLRIGMAADYGF
jgi:hypothetical protein